MNINRILKSAIILVAILTNVSLFAASDKFEVTGQVKDQESNEGLMFCNVVVYSPNDSLITGVASDDKGFFSLYLPNGDYKITASYTGYVSQDKPVKVERTNVFAGVFKLVASNELEEVTVSATTRENKTDRVVHMVTKSLRTGSSTTSDVLGKVQGVTYDRYNQEIKVDGDAKVVLLVNGLKKSPDYIKNLSPERLKEVEIIRNPPGRWALEGYTAVINIVLKTDYKGSEFFIAEDAYIDTDAASSDRLLPVNYFTVSYNYTYDKLNMYTSFKNTRNDFNLFTELTKHYNDSTWMENTSLTDDENQYISRFTNDYTFGFDYYINPKHTLSFESNIQALPDRTDDYEEAYQTSHFNNGTLEQYESFISSESSSQNYVNSLFYVYRINDKNTINTDFTVTKYIDNYKQGYVEQSILDVAEDGTNNKLSTDFNFEYEHKLNDKSSVIAGYGNVFRKLDNSNLITAQSFTDNQTLIDTGDYESSELRQKFYAYYTLQMNKKLSMKVGAAGENSNRKVGSTTESYNIFQPHFDLKYDVHKMLNLKLKYRANSKYPSINQSTPFSHVVDRYTTEQGNPFLEPELSHKVSLNVFAVMGALTFEPYYEFSNNYIIKAISEVEDGQYQLNYDNADEFKSKGIKANLTIPLFNQKLIIQSGIDYSVNSITYNNRTNTTDDYVMNSQVIYNDEKHDFVALITVQKNMQKYVKAQGYINTGLDFWMLYAQKEFYDKKLSVNIGYMLPINWGVEYNQEVYTQAGSYEKRFTNDVSMLKNVLMVGVKFRFNQGRKVKSQDKDINLNIEKASKGIF